VLKYPEERFWTMTLKQIKTRYKIHQRFNGNEENEIGYIDEIF